MGPSHSIPTIERPVSVGRGGEVVSWGLGRLCIDAMIGIRVGARNKIGDAGPDEGQR